MEVGPKQSVEFRFGLLVAAGFCMYKKLQVRVNSSFEN